MIKGVLFDVDNTLIDFMEMKKRCTVAAIKSMKKTGLKIGLKKATKIIFETYANYHIEDHTIYQKFLEQYLGYIDYKILASGIFAYRKTRETQLKPYKGIKKTLRILKNKGMKLGIVSDAPRLQMWLRLKQSGLINYFDFAISFDDTNELKPSIKPFKKALEMMNLEAKEVVFIGDNYDRDVQGAKNIGMHSILALYGNTSIATDEFFAEKPKEIISIIEKIN